MIFQKEYHLTAIVIGIPKEAYPVRLQTFKITATIMVRLSCENERCTELLML